MRTVSLRFVSAMLCNAAVVASALAAATNATTAASATKRFPAALRCTPSVVRTPRSLLSELFFFR